MLTHFPVRYGFVEPSRAKEKTKQAGMPIFTASYLIHYLKEVFPISLFTSYIF